MNDLERLDHVDRLLSDALDKLDRWAQTTLDREEVPEHEAWLRVLDARDEIRTLRARLVSGASSVTD